VIILQSERHYELLKVGQPVENRAFGIGRTLTLTPLRIIGGDLECEIKIAVDVSPHLIFVALDAVE
jgi:hypothetical protein